MQLLPAILLATVSGLLLAPFYSIPQISGWSLALVSLATAVLLRRWRRLSIALLLFSFFLGAHLRYPLEFPAVSDLTRVSAERRPLAISGEIIKTRQYADGRTCLDIRVEQFRDRGSVHQTTLRQLLRLYLEQGNGRLLPGDRVEFSARPRIPRLFGTPGEFNGPRHLAGQGIALTAWLKNAEELKITHPGRDDFGSLLAAWRQAIAEFIQAKLPSEQSGMVRALTLGEARMLTDDVRQQLALAGISHLFAISGLHLGLLALFAYRLGLLAYRRIPRLLLWQPPQRVLPLLLIPLLLFYLLLTGDAIATRRAFSLAVLSCGLVLWRRQVNPLRLLLLLALLFLLADPLVLWQPAWQLSFSGVAGILFWRPLWQIAPQKMHPVPRLLIRLLLVTLAATLATLPLVLLNFHLFAPAGLVANLICVPLVAFLALPVGLFGLVLFSITPELAGVAFKLCGAILQLLLACANQLTELPGLHGFHLFLTPWQHLAIALLALPILLFPSCGAGSRHFIPAALLTLAGATLCWFNPFSGRPQLQLTMFSVGQGESLLLTNRSGQAVLIDGGGLYGDHFDVGERLLAPALGYLGVQELDAVLLTHNHPDHWKGLDFVLRQLPVKEFWSGHSMGDLATPLQNALKRMKVPYRRIQPGWTAIDRWNHGKLELFANSLDNRGENNRSVVMYWHSDGQGVLLTGDLEAEGVNALLSSGFSGPVGLLKLPHHGSRHSRSEKLVELLKPQICLVSAGYQNPYRLPARELVAYLEHQGMPLFRTDLQGSLQATLAKGGWSISHWENGLYH